MNIVGNILPNGEIEREFCGQGFIYKNLEAFTNKTDEVCYIPELDDEKYTYKDFVRICQEFIDNNEDVKEYCKREETTAEDIAVNLFEFVDWQHPETLVDEWEMYGSYTE
jgi:hypothetical protein